jgi:hypothetical protein
MHLCRDTSRILNTDAPRRAALVRNPARSESEPEVRSLQTEPAGRGLREVAYALVCEPPCAQAPARCHGTLTSHSVVNPPNVLSHNLKVDPIKAQNLSHACGSASAALGNRSQHQRREVALSTGDTSGRRNRHVGYSLKSRYVAAVQRTGAPGQEQPPALQKRLRGRPDMKPRPR